MEIRSNLYRAGFEAEFFNAKFFTMQNSFLKSVESCAIRAALLFIHVDVLTTAARAFNGPGKGLEHLLHLHLAETNPARSGSHGLLPTSSTSKNRAQMPK